MNKQEAEQLIARIHGGCNEARVVSDARGVVDLFNPRYSGGVRVGCAIKHSRGEGDRCMVMSNGGWCPLGKSEVSELEI